MTPKKAHRLEIAAVKANAAALASLKSASQTGDPNAQAALGDYYSGKKDYSKALYWFRKAAAQGNADAKFGLGLAYDLGRGVPQDYVMAAYWYLMAAKQGDALAENNLGGAYWLGQGVPQDYAKSAYWFRKAAKQGNALAENNLGGAHANGLGVSQDYVQAIKWFILAKFGGLKQANKPLSMLEGVATQAQIAKGQRLANQWWKAHHKQ